MPHWSYRTDHGLWTISRGTNGQWHPTINGRSLGTYASPISALRDLVGSARFRQRTGIDTTQAGLPKALVDWTPHGR